MHVFWRSASFFALVVLCFGVPSLAFAFDSVPQCPAQTYSKQWTTVFNYNCEPPGTGLTPGNHVGDFAISPDGTQIIANSKYVDINAMYLRASVNAGSTFSPALTRPATTYTGLASLVLTPSASFFAMLDTSGQTTVKLGTLSQQGGTTITLIDSTSGTNGASTQPNHNYTNLAIAPGGATRLLNPTDVAVSGNYAYVAATGSGVLEIINISNPANLTHVSSVSGLSGVNAVFVSGNYAYVTYTTGGQGSLGVVDVSNPAAPTLVGSIQNGQGGALLDGANDVHVVNGNAFVTAYNNNALEVINVSNPNSPTHAASVVDGQGGAKLVQPTSVFVSGGYAYVTSWGSNALEIISVVNDANVPSHRSYLTASNTSLTGPSSVYVSGTYAYVVAQTGSALVAVDVSIPSAPVVAGSLFSGAGGSLFTNPERVTVSGNYAYISSGPADNQIEVVDISNPAALSHAIRVEHNTDGPYLKKPMGIVVSGGYVFVASNYSNALEVLDVFAQPTHKGVITDDTGLKVYATGAGEAGLADGSIYSTSYTSGYAPIWFKTGAPQGSWSAIAASTDGTKLAATDGKDRNGYIWTSTDKGATWAQSTSPLGAWSAIAASTDGTKLAATQNNVASIYLSSTFGASWSAIPITAPFFNPQIRSLASSGDGSRIFAADGGNANTFYYSTNGGLTWTTGSIMGTSGAYHMDKVSMTSDGSTVYMLANSGQQLLRLVFADLTASAPATATTTVGVATPYSMNITNTGPGDTLADVRYFFQLSSGPGTTVNDLSGGTLTSVAANQTVPVSTTLTLFTPGTYNLRVCADKQTASDQGSIVETDENNNCSGWTGVSVSAVATGTISATECTLSGSSCPMFVTWSSQSANQNLVDIVVTPPNGAMSTSYSGQASLGTLTHTANDAGSYLFKLYSYGTNTLLDSTTTTVSLTPTLTCDNTSACTVNVGTPVSLHWDCLVPGSVGSGNFMQNPATSGTIDVTPATTTTYVLQCTPPGSFNQTTVTVLFPDLQLTASPALVRIGEPGTLQWSAANVTSCTLRGPSGVISTDTYGTFATGPIVNKSEFTLTCVTGLGDMSITKTINNTPVIKEN